MAKEEQVPKQDFFYSNNAFGDSNFKSTSIVQPKMLPPFFRERTRLLQKLYVFLIVIFMALAVGVTAYVMINNLAGKYGLVSSTQSTHLIFSLVLWYAVIIGVGFFVWWSRRRSYIIDPASVAAVIVPPLVLSIVSLVYFLRSDVVVSNQESQGLFLVFAAAALASAIVSILIIVISNLINNRGYREAKFRSFYTLGGLGVVAIAPLIVWAVSQTNNFATFEVTEVIYPLIPLIVGAALIGLGAILSNRYKPQDVQLASQYVQISSSLSSVVIFLTLFILGLSFASSGEFSTPLIGALVIDLALVIGFGFFIYLRGRIKNIVTTSPVFNELVVKGLLVVISIIGLIFISTTSDLVLSSSYAPTTFGLLAITGATCFLVVSIAHFANLVVFEKFAKTLFVGSLIAMAAILILSFVMGSLPNSSVFVNLFAVGIAITMIVAPLLIECAILIVAILTIEADVILESNNQRGLKARSRARAKLEEDASLEKNTVTKEQQVGKGA